MHSPRIVGEREPSPPPIYDPLGDEAGLMVLTAPELSAADKLAWALLRQRTQSGRLQVRISPREVGEHQGVTADAGRQRLKNLRDKFGLIEATSCNKTGTWLVTLLDPRMVLRATKRLVLDDPQRCLPFGDVDEPTGGEALSESQVGRPGDAPSSPPGITLLAEEPPEEPSEEPPEDPRRASGLSGLSELSVPPAHFSRPLTISRPSGLSAQSPHSKELAPEEPRRGTSGDAANGEEDFAAQLARRQSQLGISRPAIELDVERAAAIAAAVARRVPTERELAANRERWIQTIRERVNDPRLKTCVMVKVACAVVSGQLDPEDVEQILHELRARQREGNLRAPPGAYFVSAARRCFHRHGIEWTGYATLASRKAKPR